MVGQQTHAQTGDDEVLDQFETVDPVREPAASLITTTEVATPSWSGPLTSEAEKARTATRGAHPA